MGRPKMTDEEKFQAKAKREMAKDLEHAMQGMPEGARVVTIPKDVDAEPLKDYIARVEAVHVGRDVFAVEITHPEASAGVHPGRFSGIRLKQGAPSVTYSDGTKE